MANKLTWVSIVSLALLSTVPLFKLVMLPAHSESLMIAGRKGIRGQEMGGVKESPERVDEVVASYLTRVQIPHSPG